MNKKLMSKKLLLLGIVSMLVMACVLASCSGEPTNGEPTNGEPTNGEEVFEWRMQSSVGSDVDEVYDAYVEKIYKATGGRIDITYYQGGSIVANDQLLDAVGQGTIEIGYCYGGYWPGLVDVANIESGLPFSWMNTDEVVYMYYSLGFIDLVREAYAEHNVYYFCPSIEGVDSYLLLTKEPVNSLQDLAGKKIRATGPVGIVLEKFGASSVYIPPEELYTSLATGVLDGVVYGGHGYMGALGMYEVATYFTYPSVVSPVLGNIFVNMDVWNTLPEDLQQIVESITKEHFFTELSRWSQSLEREGRGLYPFEETYLSSEDVAALVEAVREVWEEEAAKSARCAQAVDMLEEIAEKAGRL